MMSDGIQKRFSRWFRETMSNADGKFDHLPKWLKNDMHLAYTAGYMAGKKAGEDHAAAELRIRQKQPTKKPSGQRRGGFIESD